MALNTLLEAPRRSRDVDLFHDRAEAVARTVEEDVALLQRAGYAVRFVRQAPTFAEVVVEKEGAASLVQWVQDSAYRFFPLVEHEDFGLSLHPFDLATNKTLAMAGRLELRDWVDLVTCHGRLQPLGYLVWAACGKDPGFSPRSLLQDMRRASKVAQEELDLLDFGGPPPDAGELSRAWRQALRAADTIIDCLPPEQAGACVAGVDGGLCQAAPSELPELLAADRVRFHRGTIGGAWPTFPPLSGT